MVGADQGVAGQGRDRQVRQRPGEGVRRQRPGGDGDRRDPGELEHRPGHPVEHQRRPQLPVTPGRGERRVGERGQRYEDGRHPQSGGVLGDGVRPGAAGGQPGQRRRRDEQSGAEDGGDAGDRGEAGPQAAAEQVPLAPGPQSGRPVDQPGLGAELGDRADQHEEGGGGEERAGPFGAEAAGGQPGDADPGDRGESGAGDPGHPAPGHRPHPGPAGARRSSVHSRRNAVGRDVHRRHEGGRPSQAVSCSSYGA
ncbi:hypothetical protein GCM10009779_14920 [Polymorphospora rubra]